VTDIHKLRNTDQRLYLYAARHNGRTLVHGGLKIGTKKLFVIAVCYTVKLILCGCMQRRFLPPYCDGLSCPEEERKTTKAVKTPHINLTKGVS